MTSIYFNNFRGFEKTFVELQNVNFFLGENSTGKTSVLKLIRILSDPNFKIKYDLGEEFAEIGTFHDIVYKGSGQNYFEIGYQAVDSLICLVLKSRENKPTLHKLYVSIEMMNIEFSFEENDFHYRYFPQSEKVNFADWIKQIDGGKFEGESVNAGSFEFNERMPLSAIVFSIGDKIFSSKRKDGEKITPRDLGELYLSFFKALESPQLPALTWIDPIRAEPRRLYDEYSSAYTPTGSHAPYVLKQLLTSKDKRNNFKIKEFLKYGKASGLFSEIIPKVFDKKDESSPFELLIMIGSKAIKLNHVGYGVSQVLPLVVEVMKRGKGSWIAIQQPEVHLHPKAQAAFGDFLFAFAERDEKKFIVETHSDFLVDRFRLAMNKFYSPRKKERVKGQICFFERTSTGNMLTQIPILQDGSYSDDLPDAFRDFFLKEQLELLSM